MRAPALVATVAMLLATAAQATISFTQLDDNVFSVSHRVKVIGSRGKATKMVFTKAASLCIAAGYSHLQVIQQESEASQKDDAANASLRVKFFFEDGDDRIGCEGSADPQYVQEAKAKLQKRRYVAPEVFSQSPANGKSEKADAGTESCTIEQIAAMARAGLSDDKIRAACGEDG